jgi:FtsZ-binding cell division protein ZapB
MDLEALRIKRELLYREAREINEQRHCLDRNLRHITGGDAVACHRRSLLQAEFDELTIRLRTLSVETRQITQKIDEGLSQQETWSNDPTGL